MRTLAIGDIHGCFTALQTVVSVVELSSEDNLVTLGDYIDRGPQVPQVLVWLRERYRSGRLVPLLGNHEIMLRACRTDKDLFQDWLEFGGRATLEAYGSAQGELSLDDIPKEDWDFIEEYCVPWHETEKHIFVHAGLHPNLPLSRQYEQVLFWDRVVEHTPHYSGKTMICGHTPQADGKPTHQGHAIYLDTGAYLENGWLTCLDIDSGEVWQGNQAGDSRNWYLGKAETS